MSILRKTLLDRDYQRRLQGLPTIEEEIEILKQQLSKKEKAVRKNQSSLPKQLLILYYLDQLNNFDLSNVKNAKLLSALLNGDEQNIRSDLSDFIDNQLRSKSALKHLKEIELLFKEVGLNEKMQSVKNDIVRIKEKKL